MRKDQVEEAKDYLWELEEQVKQLREAEGDLHEIAGELKKNELFTMPYIFNACMYIRNGIADLDHVIESLDRTLELYR